MNRLQQIIAFFISLATLVGLIVHCLLDKERFKKLEEDE